MNWFFVSTYVRWWGMGWGGLEGGLTKTLGLIITFIFLLFRVPARVPLEYFFLVLHRHLCVLSPSCDRWLNSCLEIDRSLEFMFISSVFLYCKSTLGPVNTLVVVWLVHKAAPLPTLVVFAQLVFTLLTQWPRLLTYPVLETRPARLKMANINKMKSILEHKMSNNFFIFSQKFKQISQ